MANTIHTTYRKVWDKQKGDYVNVPFTITVDFEAIADAMAMKAFKNSSGVSKIAAGAIVCTKGVK